MNKIYNLIHQCLQTGLTPEHILQVPLEDTPEKLPPEIVQGDINTFVHDATYVRFPEVLRTFIYLRGMEASETAANLYIDITEDLKNSASANANNEDLTAQNMENFVNVYLAGVSLSWWLFGIGQAMCQPFFLNNLDPDKQLNDYVRNLNYKQGWSDLEGKWFLTQIHQSTEKKLTHRVMIRLMSGLPKMQFFPKMPAVIDVYKRLERVVQEFKLPDKCPIWMEETITILRNSTWRACILMLVRQGSVSHWQVVGQVPRRKSGRLAFAISLLFDLYGEQKGMEYYLTVLNLEAQAQGFEDLSAVARGAVWKLTSSDHSQKD